MLEEEKRQVMHSNVRLEKELTANRKELKDIKYEIFLI